MSKDEKQNGLTVTEQAKAIIDSGVPAYDFAFIVQALGLIPVNGGKEAINPGAVTNVFRDEERPDVWIFAFVGGDECAISDSEMGALEGQLRMRAEAMRQMMQGGNLIAAPTMGKRFRQ